MKVVGLFRELERTGNMNLPSIHDARDSLPIDLALKIALYLRRGEPVFDVMGFTVDPFDPSRGVPGGPSLLTDGQWTWRHDLAYFVEKYCVAISSEFIKHALNNNIEEMDRAAAIKNYILSLKAMGWQD